MIPPIPKIHDYQVSPDNGFLPAEPPLSRLPDPYYDPWEDVMANLRTLLVAKRIRAVVEDLPILSTSRLRTEAEWRRAYVVLGFITNSYIWGLEKAKDVCFPGLVFPFLLFFSLFFSSFLFFSYLLPSPFPPFFPLPMLACFRAEQQD